MTLTPRDRFIRTLTFQAVDRVTLSPGGPRESTLAAWRTQGLPAEVPWTEALAAEVGLPTEALRTPMAGLGVDFRMIPWFEEKVLERRDGHLVVQDWKGNVCEIDDRYDVTYLREAKDFVTRRWIRCPVETRDDWAQMKQRYQVDAAGRFPDDFDDRCAALADRDAVLVVSMPGPFWQLREWCGFEPLCMMMVEQPELVDEMAAFWREFVAELLERICRHVAPDLVHVSEDMAYKEKMMISPAMVARWCEPAWRRWANIVRAAGTPLVDVDSDGFIGELVPRWIACGVNVCDPVEVAAANDIVALRREHGRQMAYRGGVDKRAMARGGEAIRRELDRIAPVVADGGYVPGCDHGIPSDVSWPAMVDYTGLLARVTGWL